MIIGIICLGLPFVYRNDWKRPFYQIIRCVVLFMGDAWCYWSEKYPDLQVFAS